MNVQLQIYRIAQEVLTNIQRHSNAEVVEMAVAIGDKGDFLLTIGDNGTAFQPGGPIGKGRGISNIRSRADLIKATVGWKEQSKRGNLFSLKMPI